jgi:prolyl-tRNA synthetase
VAPSARNHPAEEMKKVPTPGKKTCEAVAELLGLPLQRTVKAVAVMHDDAFHLLLVRGDHTLNEIKAAKAIGTFRFATAAEILGALHCEAGYIGPVGAKGVKLVADRSVAAMSDFVCGANEAGFHLTGVNFGRDLAEPETADIRNVVAGDPSPDGKGRLEIVRGIEVGHIFQLRTKYSEAMKAAFLDQAGKQQPFEMGCYGIGVTRIVGAAIEQNHDQSGIVFPAPIAPFEACIVPIGYAKSAAVRAAADKLYGELVATGVDVLLDDRDERPGVLFADMDLIGIPHRVVLGERGLAAGNAEYKGRRDDKVQDVPLGAVAGLLREKLKAG